MAESGSFEARLCFLPVAYWGPLKSLAGASDGMG